MAKTGVSDSDPTVTAKATELKKELQRLVRAILDDEDCSTETIDRAKEKICALKELKLRGKRALSLKLLETLTCPEEFRCPLSKELMRDPVLVATGQVGIHENLDGIFFFFGNSDGILFALFVS